MTSEEGVERRSDLAAKVDRLFRTIRPAGRGEYSNQEVADAVRAAGGPTISRTYLWQLRKGLRDNPTREHLEALSDFFGVSPAYFFDHDAAAQIDGQLELVAALRDHGVRQIALRSVGLSEDSLAVLAEMVERVRQLEGLTGDDGGNRPEGARP